MWILIFLLQCKYRRSSYAICLLWEPWLREVRPWLQELETMWTRVSWWLLWPRWSLPLLWYVIWVESYIQVSTIAWYSCPKSLLKNKVNMFSSILETVTILSYTRQKTILSYIIGIDRTNKSKIRIYSRHIKVKMFYMIFVGWFWLFCYISILFSSFG